MPDQIGVPFHLQELSALDVLAGLSSYTVAVNDPPWSGLAARAKPPRRIVRAWDMEISALEAMLDPSADGAARTH